MNETKDGGTAFPVNTANLGGSGACYPQPGMSLRDFFAAKAMQALIASHGAKQEWIENCGVMSAYQIADAMLKERER